MKLNSILATDCGSTTTKAILIENIEGEYRLTVRGEAPTTVEAPFEDVTKGVLNAVMEVEELAGRKLLDGDNIMSPQKDGVGVDIYISTSSAGGGLQMMVAGAVKSMTGESAERAALSAGSIVMDVIASNDGRLPHEKIKRIRQLRPDMILLAGGTDGGTVSHVVELAEILRAANPKPRLGQNYKLPVIYAGNTKKMSAKHTLKLLWKLEQSHGSIIRGILKSKKDKKSKINSGFHYRQKTVGSDPYLEVDFRDLAKNKKESEIFPVALRDEALTLYKSYLTKIIE